MQLNKKHLIPLKSMLMESGFTFTAVPYAYWKASLNGGHIVFYESGKLLVQGNKLAQDNINRLLSEFLEQGSKDHPDTLGLDESGKGDFFGPLVLAGAIVPGAMESELHTMGICDSKLLTDDKIKKYFSLIKNKIIWQIKVLEPPLYNQLYADWNNLNLLMIDQYKKLILSFSDEQFEKVILDRFSSSDKQNRMIHESVSKEMIIVPRAEQFPAVAVASIIARYHFIQWIESQNPPLPKGSGPQAKKLFLKLRQNAESSDFSSVAKTHFLSK